MRCSRPRAPWTALATLAILAIGCSSVTLPNKPASSTTPEVTPTTTASGRLEVFVQWEGVGVADVRLEILETGQSATTDASGHATFTLDPGNYTLRAYVIKKRGPGTTDVNVSITSGDTKQVAVRDCLPCRED
jgi:hypothetical protein